MATPKHTFFRRTILLTTLSSSPFANLTITLPEERLQKLKTLAEQFQIAPEDLARISIEELLARPEEEFRRAVTYVLKKNAKLYERLA